MPVLSVAFAVYDQPNHRLRRKETLMLASMLYLYPKTAVDKEDSASVRTQESQICDHWGASLSAGAPVVCAGLLQGQIDAIKQALRKGDSGVSLKTIVSMVQEPGVSRALKEMLVAVASRHPSGFSFKWADITHPDGYAYVVVGLVV